MKLTLSWLKDHLETEASLEEIVETLTMIGLEVEEVDDRSAFKPFKIAKVLTAEQHPDADRLRVLSVDTGDGKPVQVVCGAPNARAGLVGAFAAPGTYVPGIDVTLAVGNIRGVESHGMMCSERELEISDEHDGIIDLPDDAPVGSDYAAYAGLDDPVIEIGITPNRPDALGVAGIARDLAAAGLGTVKSPEINPVAGSYPCPVTVDLDLPGEPELCPAFGLRLVKNISNGPSPKWMQQRLLAIGLRPISALVDITNYVTFDRGRPLHVFDADKVAGNLVVRKGREGDEVLGLDGKTYKFNENHVVIADDNGVESIGGIMGGEHSGCDENTKNVLIESALWDPMNIARSGRDLGIITDARYRFERGVDPAFNLPGLEYATQLVTDMCGGEPSDVHLAGAVPEPKLEIDFPVSEVKRLTGIDVEADSAKVILERLGFTVSGSAPVYQVNVPSTRPDVFGKADLVEEVMRIYGINNVESQPLPRHGSIGETILTTGQIRARNARRALAVRGMAEAVTWSFISADQAKLFGGGDPSLTLSNPIAAGMSDMRPSLLPSLIMAGQRNADHGFPDSTLFEVAHVYHGDQPSDQHRVAGGIRRNTARHAGGGRHWSGSASGVDVFQAKADALSVLEACGLDPTKVQIVVEAPDWYHPGRSGSIKLGPKVVLGTFGEIHPRTLEKLDADGPIAAFEIMLDALPQPRRKATKTKSPLSISGLQAVKRDFAFVVDDTVSADSILRAARGADKKLISDVSVFDLFAGASIGEGRKSVAIEVTLQPTVATLTDEEIDAVAANIVEKVGQSTGATLRG
ncbi:MAG: phenylalanine--tRNA ligase subunit beta [Pseudomonadota bacterium]